MFIKKSKSILNIAAHREKTAIMNQNSLRKSFLTARDHQKPDQRWEKNTRILSRLLEEPLITAAKHLFVYVGFRSEVATSRLIDTCIKAGKTVSAPVTLVKESRMLAVRLTDPTSQLEPGCFGIPEPTREQIEQATLDPADIDLVLVPGSVFDRNGGRIGYGGGFYDRFLSRDAPQATRFALAYELQMVEQVPMEVHDQYMDRIITEEQIYDCRRIRDAQNSSV